MKKNLVILTFVLIAASLVTPKFIATRYQDKLAELVANLDNTAGYSAKIESTESAWFGSETKLLIGFDISQIDPSLEKVSLETELIIDTHYGPLLFNKQGLFGLYSSQIRIQGDKLNNILTWDKSQPLYQLSILGGFTGHLTLTDAIPPLSNPTNTFQFSGYSGKGEMQEKGFMYEGTLAEIKIKDAYKQTKAEGFRFSVALDSDLETVMKGGFYDSNINFRLDKFNIDTTTELSGLTMTVNSALDHKTQLGKLEMAYFIKEAAFKSFKANDLALVTQFNKLSNPFFLNYKAFSDSLFDTSHSTDYSSQALFSFTQKNIHQLLATQPEFNITDFSGTFPEGSFNANLTSKLADINTPTLDELATPAFWLYNTMVNANMEVDAPLLNTLAANFVAAQMHAPLNSAEVKQQVLILLDHFTQQGLIKQQDNKYLSELKIRNGQAQIYQQTFPLM